jgi:hypothetical protein
MSDYWGTKPLKYPINTKTRPENRFGYFLHSPQLLRHLSISSCCVSDSKYKSRSIGNPKDPYTDFNSDNEQYPISISSPTTNPKKISSQSNSLAYQIHCASGVKNLTFANGLQDNLGQQTPVFVTLSRIIYQLVEKVTAGVTCTGADGGTPSDEKKAEAWKMPENCAESPASGVRFVRRENVTGKLLARPYSARERNIDLSLARSRLLNKPDDGNVGGSYTCDQSSARGFLHERADLCLFGGGQLLQREGGRPHGAFVEVRRVAEA